MPQKRRDSCIVRSSLLFYEWRILLKKKRQSQPVVTTCPRHLGNISCQSTCSIELNNLCATSSSKIANYPSRGRDATPHHPKTAFPLKMPSPQQFPCTSLPPTAAAHCFDVHPCPCPCQHKKKHLKARGFVRFLNWSMCPLDVDNSVSYAKSTCE